MDKERLEDIKDRYMDYEYDFNLKKSDIDWLIQQAEQVEELDRKGMSLAEDFIKLKVQNQRYKQVLEYTSSELEYAHVTGDQRQKDSLIKGSLKVIDEALEGE